MWFNPIIKMLLSSPLHFFISKNMVLIQYTGRKSGKMYTTPVNYFTLQDDEGEYLLTTSFQDRVWWRNLRGGAPITLRLKGQERSAQSTVIEDPPQVIQQLDKFFRAYPHMAKYFQVSLDQDGEPNSQDLASSAAGRVIIQTRLTYTPANWKTLPND